MAVFSSCTLAVQTMQQLVVASVTKSSISMWSKEQLLLLIPHWCNTTLMFQCGCDCDGSFITFSNPPPHPWPTVADHHQKIRSPDRGIQTRYLVTRRYSFFQRLHYELTFSNRQQQEEQKYIRSKKISCRQVLSCVVMVVRISVGDIFG